MEKHTLSADGEHYVELIIHNIHQTSMSLN